MNEFIITEDFPDNQQEFDKRFSEVPACYEYLFRMRWPQAFHCSRCAHRLLDELQRDLHLSPMRIPSVDITTGRVLHSTKNPLWSS